jgi:peptidoglycan/LPS O-acetylase OafA/YrhL
MHFAVIKLLGKVFSECSYGRGDRGMLAAFPLVVFVTVLISILSYNRIERPAIRLGNMIGSKCEGDSPRRN